MSFDCLFYNVYYFNLFLMRDFSRLEGFQKIHFSKVPVENKYFPNDFNAICYFFRDLKLSNYACYRLLKLRNIIFSKKLVSHRKIHIKICTFLYFLYILFYAQSPRTPPENSCTVLYILVHFQFFICIQSARTPPEFRSRNRHAFCTFLYIFAGPIWRVPQTCQNA